LETPILQRILGTAEPAAQVDFSKVRIRYQPPAPPYPKEAKSRRIQGIVVVEVTQDREGRVIRARAIDGPEELRPTSEAYAACWRFFPIPADEKADRLQFRLTMPFRVH
jgi:TonB family protein